MQLAMICPGLRSAARLIHLVESVQLAAPGAGRVIVLPHDAPHELTGCARDYARSDTGAVLLLPAGGTTLPQMRRAAIQAALHHWPDLRLLGYCDPDLMLRPPALQHAGEALAARAGAEAPHWVALAPEGRAALFRAPLLADPAIAGAANPCAAAQARDLPGLHHAQLTLARRTTPALGSPFAAPQPRPALTTPRYALIDAATPERVVLFADPAGPLQSLSRGEFVQRLQTAPGWRQGDMPPPQHLLLARPGVIADLQRRGLWHGALWRLDLSASRSGRAALQLCPGAPERIGWQMPEPLQAPSPPDLLLCRLSGLADPQPPPGPPAPERLTLPETAAPCPQAPPLEALLTSFHKELRSAPQGPAGLPDRSPATEAQATGWLTGGLPLFPRAPGRRQIGFLLPLIEFGGVERVALTLARALKAEGCDVHVFVLGAQSARRDAEWDAATASFTFWPEAGYAPWPPGDRAFFGNRLPEPGTGAAQAMRHTAAALFWWLTALIDFHTGVLAAQLGPLRALGLKLVSSQHLTEPAAMGRPAGFPYLALAYEENFDLIVTASQQLSDLLCGLGLARHKSLVLRNTPGFDLKGAAPRPARQPDQPLRILWLGRLDPQKGMDRLAALQPLCAGFAPEWRVIGAPVLGAAPPPLTAPPEPPLHRAEDLARVYGGADLLLLLSDYEGLPLTLLEAMRQGVVPLATDVGALRDVVQHGRNGLLLPQSGLVAAAAAALRRLHEDRGLLQRLAQAAGETAATGPTPQDNARALLNRLAI